MERGATQRRERASEEQQTACNDQLSGMMGDEFADWSGDGGRETRPILRRQSEFARRKR